MAEEFNDLTFGDETRRNGDYVPFPVSEAESGGLSEGDVVAVDGETGNLVPAADGDAIVGVLYTFQYFEQANAGEQIDYELDATVKVGGTVKAHVAQDVSAGDTLAAGLPEDEPESGDPDTTGVFEIGDADANVANYQALSDAEQQVGGPRPESQHSEPDRDGDYFAEVRLR